MGRMLRHSLPDGYFHVFARGMRGRGIFRDDDDRAAFLSLLSACEPRPAWVCHAFSLLSTHYHLVLEATRENLSVGLHRLNGCYARRCNKRHGLFGHVFAERISARRIDGEEYLYDACEYVVLNSVRAWLCGRVEDWPWSYSRFGLAATPPGARPSGP